RPWGTRGAGGLQTRTEPQANGARLRSVPGPALSGFPRTQGDDHDHPRAPPGRGVHLEVPADELQPLAHAGEAEAVLAGAARVQRAGVEARPFVLDPDHDPGALCPSSYAGAIRPGVLD